MRVLDQNNEEVKLLESADYEVTDFKKVLDDGNYRRNSKDEESELKHAGNTIQTFDESGEAQYVEDIDESADYMEDDGLDEEDFEEDLSDEFDVDEDYGDGNADIY